MAWVLATLVAKTFDVSLPVALFTIAMLLPAIIPLSLAIYLVWKQRSAEQLSLLPFNPAIALLVTIVWFLVSMLLASDPGEHAVTGIMWWVVTLGLALAWLGVFVAAIQTLGATAWSVLRRMMWVALYVAPLPVAVYLVMLLAGQEELPVRARFELSETALYEDIRQPQHGSHRVGLFQVTHVSKMEECTFLETGGDSLDQGFAYCPESLPAGTNGSPATVFMSPVNGSWEDSDWWTYDVAGVLELAPEVN